MRKFPSSDHAPLSSYASLPFRVVPKSNASYLDILQFCTLALVRARRAHFFPFIFAATSRSSQKGLGTAPSKQKSPPPKKQANL